MTYRFPSTTILNTAALAVAALLAAAAIGGATAPNTMSDWDQRITASLLQTGTVDPIVADLSKAVDTADVRKARVRAAIESGDLSNAITNLREQIRSNPADVDALQQLAAAEETLGQSDAAEQSLRAALAKKPDVPTTRALTLRLAALLFDNSQADAATAALNGLVESDPSTATAAGVVAYLAGQWDAASRYLNAAGNTAIGARLLGGSAAMKAGHAEAALGSFTTAANDAVKPADRLYAQDRVIAAARQAGTLPKLADAWLAQPDLPASRMLPLATVLRELGRVPELLQWWHAAAADPARSKTVLSERFVREILGAAQSAGKADDTLAICRDMLHRNPEDPQWLTASCRALIDHGTPTDADALLTTRLNAVADQPAELQSLGKLARTLGRNAVALEAGKRLAGFGGDAAIKGELLSVSVYQSTGDTTRAAATLRRAAADAERHPTESGEVVNALEAAGLQDEAVKLLKAALAHDPDDETTLGRLASLLLDLHRPAEAIPVLERLSRSTSASGAVRSQASRQLLSASADEGVLPSLIARTQDRLDLGHGDASDLSLLVDAYVRTQNLDAGAQTIRTSPLLNDTDKLRRLSLLYLRAKDFNRAAPTLQKLADADPEDAAETLERLATVCVAKGDTAGATTAINRIARIAGSGPASLSLMGGVMDRLGRPVEAGAYYRRALAANPTDGDTWLLWATAMSKAGRAAEARQRLAVLADNAVADNLFAVAVDGLLNLNAKPAILRAARRAAMVRAADQPEHTVLLHVVADLSEELKDRSAQIRAAEVTVAVSDEERPERLRELMDVASQKGLIDTAADCGQTLLGLGDEFPPQLFLQLGEQLLIGGRPQDAMRAFSRASEVTDPDEVARRASPLLEQYGYPAAAAAVLTPVAGRQPNDAALAATLARLDELAGDDAAAFDRYLVAIRASIDDLPTDLDVSPKPSANGVVLFPATPAVVKTFSQLVDGAIASGRSPQQQAQLLELLQSRFHNRLGEMDGSAAPSVDLTTIAIALRQIGIATNRPELADGADAAVLNRWPGDKKYANAAIDYRIQNQLISMAIRFAAEHAVDAYPSLTMARQLAAADSSTTEPASRPTAISIDRAAEKLPAMIVKGDLNQARRVLAAVALVRPTLPSVSSPRILGMNRTVTPPVQIMVMAAAATGDTALARRWALLWLDAADLSNAPTTGAGSVSARRLSRIGGRVAPSTTAPSGIAASAVAASMNSSTPNATPAVPTASSITTYSTGTLGAVRTNLPPFYLVSQRYSPIIGGTWRFLPPDARAAFVDRLVEQESKAGDHVVRASLAMFALQLAAATPQWKGDTARLAVGSLATSAGSDPTTAAAHAFALVHAADRPALLPRILEQLPQNNRLKFLLTFVGQVVDPFDASTADAITIAAKQMPAGQTVGWPDWFANTGQRALLPALAEATLRCTTDDPAGATGADAPATLTAAAVAYAVAGDSRRADDLAARAIAAIRLAPAPVDPSDATSSTGASINGFNRRSSAPDRSGLLRLAVSAMSTDARAALLSQVDGGVTISANLTDAILLTTVLDSSNRRPKSLEVLRNGFARSPADPDLLRQYADRLQDDGYAAELVDIVGPRLGTTDSNSNAIRYTVRRDLFDLFRGREDHSEYQARAATPDLATPVAAGDVAGTTAALHAILQGMRGPIGSGSPPADKPGAGGLARPLDRTTSADSVALPVGFASRPGMLDALLLGLHMPSEPGFRTFTPYGDATHWLAKALAHAASTDADVQRGIIDQLQAIAATCMLTRGDRLLAINMASMPGIAMPRPVLDALLPAAFADDSGAEARQLADALAAQHAPQADNIGRWADALIKASPSVNGVRPGLPPVEPNPISTGGSGSNDAGIAAWLAASSITDPAATEQTMAAMRTDGLVTPHDSHCNLLWARFAAERGDVDTFRSRLTEALTAAAWQRIMPRAAVVVTATNAGPPDIRDALPARITDSARRQALLDGVVAAESTVANRWPADTDVVRQLAAIGQWAFEQGDRTAAKAILDRAISLANQQGPGEHQLWVADLARELGDDTFADDTESTLLECRCLPAVRIAPLLRRLQQHSLVTATDVQRRARDATAYCREPRVIAMAEGRPEAQ